MNKKLLLGIGALVIVAALAAAAVSVVFAQTPTPPDATPGYGRGLMNGRGPMMGDGVARGGMRGAKQGMLGNLEPGWMHAAMLDAFAEALDLHRAALEERLAAGETMRDIALAEDLMLDEFFAVMSEARAAALAQAVEEGTLTQEQADAMAARMAQRRARMGGGGMMRGGRMGNGGYGNCPFANPSP
jgi:hypothetical protein